MPFQFETDFELNETEREQANALKTLLVARQRVQKDATIYNQLMAALDAIVKSRRGYRTIVRMATLHPEIDMFCRSPVLDDYWKEPLSRVWEGMAPDKQPRPKPGSNFALLCSFVWRGRWSSAQRYITDSAELLRIQPDLRPQFDTERDRCFQESLKANHFYTRMDHKNKMIAELRDHLKTQFKKPVEALTAAEREVIQNQFRADMQPLVQYMTVAEKIISEIQKGLALHQTPIYILLFSTGIELSMIACHAGAFGEFIQVLYRQVWENFYRAKFLENEDDIYNASYGHGLEYLFDHIFRVYPTVSVDQTVAAGAVGKTWDAEIAAEKAKRGIDCSSWETIEHRLDEYAWAYQVKDLKSFKMGCEQRVREELKLEPAAFFGMKLCSG
ncbi:MAG: DUF5630 domain-containing protein [Pseudomonadota bacterium]